MEDEEEEGLFMLDIDEGSEDEDGDCLSMLRKLQLSQITEILSNYQVVARKSWLVMVGRGPPGNI